MSAELDQVMQHLEGYTRKELYGVALAMRTEIERLRALITKWADADNAVTAAADARPFVREPYDVAIERCDRAYDALRKEAGR